MNLGGDSTRALPALVSGFLLAFAVALVVTPLILKFARRHGMVDQPEARRVNTRTVARGGGIAVAIGFLVISILMLGLNAAFDFVDEPDSVDTMKLAGLLGGGALAVGIGLLDDVYQIRARYQLVGQLVLAAFAATLGLQVTHLYLPLGFDITFTGDLAILAILATFVWVVGMLNSINFIDGLDGLSSGIALIAAVTLGIISLTTGPEQPYVALFCFILAGALAGFLRWNFHPAAIFSGTSGIMFVGYTLAALSILGTAKVAVAVLVLGVPIIDTFWIIVRRLASGRSPFAADRGHIHHRLLDLGLSHRGTVLVIYGACILLAILSLLLSNTGQMYAFMGLVALFGLALLLIERLGPGGAAIEESLDADSYNNGTHAGEPVDADA
jgi:UDP-GlcNAc:undecaprenyl-phosphate GlcNAc-1-phosphate transferase